MNQFMGNTPQSNSDRFIRIWEIHEYFLRKNKEERIKEFLNQILAEDDDAPPTSEEELAEIRSRIDDFDGEIRINSIRLLADVPGIKYVLVLEQSAWDSYLIVPFSEFEVPAMDGELALKESGGMNLAVLQVWNARTMNALQLRRSWDIHHDIDDELREEIYAVRRHLISASPIPAELLPRTGTAITDTDGLRSSYLKQDNQQFAEIDAKNSSILNKMEDLNRLQGNTVPAAYDPALLLQAAAGGKHTKSLVYAMDCDECEILDALCKNNLTRMLPTRVATCQNPEDINQKLNVAWSMESYSGNCGNALFFYRPTGELIGHGLVYKDGDIVLHSYNDEIELPESIDISQVAIYIR